MNVLNKKEIPFIVVLVCIEKTGINFEWLAPLDTSTVLQKFFLRFEEWKQWK